MNIIFPEYIISIIKAIESYGKEAFVVGGSIRDILLKRPPKDWDITTNAVPSEIKSIFSSPPYIVISGLGEKYGTVIICVQQNEHTYPVQITTYRTEGSYIKNRYPTDVSYTTSLEEDLARRDFTMNAVAARPAKNTVELVDPMNGIYDIEKRTIRTIGNANERFEEDALRILRLIRFSSVLGFKADAETEKSAANSLHLLSGLSMERMASELDGFFSGDFYCQAALQFFYIIKTVIPESDKSNIIDDKYPDVRFAFLFPSEESCFVRLKKLRFSSSYVKRISALAALKDTKIKPAYEYDAYSYASYILRQFENRYGEACAFLSHIYGNDFANELSLYIDDIIINQKCYKLSQLAINGRDLLKIGISGKETGKVLSYLLEEVIGGKVKNCRKDLINHINISNCH